MSQEDNIKYFFISEKTSITARLACFKPMLKPKRLIVHDVDILKAISLLNNTHQLWFNDNLTMKEEEIIKMQQFIIDQNIRSEFDYFENRKIKKTKEGIVWYELINAIESGALRNSKDIYKSYSTIRIIHQDLIYFIRDILTLIEMNLLNPNGFIEEYISLNEYNNTLLKVTYIDFLRELDISEYVEVDRRPISCAIWIVIHTLSFLIKKLLSQPNIAVQVDKNAVLNRSISKDDYLKMLYVKPSYDRSLLYALLLNKKAAQDMNQQIKNAKRALAEEGQDTNESEGLSRSEIKKQGEEEGQIDAKKLERSSSGDGNGEGRYLENLKKKLATDLDKNYIRNLSKILDTYSTELQEEVNHEFIRHKGGKTVMMEINNEISDIPYLPNDKLILPDYMKYHSFITNKMAMPVQGSFEERKQLIVIMIDISSSMDSVSHEMIKEIIDRRLKAVINEESELIIYTFNCNLKQRFEVKTKEQAYAIKKLENSFYVTGGGTSIDSCVKQVINVIGEQFKNDYFDSYHYPQILLLSDGEDNVSLEEKDLIIYNKQSGFHKILLNVVMFAYDRSSGDYSSSSIEILKANRDANKENYRANAQLYTICDKQGGLYLEVSNNGRLIFASKNAK